VEEQSHKDEMRAALRGDFERMRRRQAPEATEATEPAPPMSAEEPKLVRQEARGKPWLDRLLGRG
jgi:hypothetical protein